VTGRKSRDRPPTKHKTQKIQRRSKIKKSIAAETAEEEL
jgi:hypothetical protein